jgi:SpoVK/Ycf46/Vps4 family AAA+-type ATPase
MEQYDGLAVLASNLKGNIDEAFARRLSVMVDFPDPDQAQRLRLWHRLLADAPLSPDADLDFLAASFPLTGGNIRNIAVTASYLAAADGTDVDIRCLIRGVQIEYRKLGRLCSEKEFGPYLSILRTDSESPSPIGDSVLMKG